MARVFISDESDRKHWYTVEKAVGQGCPNVRDDVFLVQFFLRRAMQDCPESKGYVPPGERPITIDGIYGQQTYRYISFYEDEANRRKPGIVTTDRIIDPINKSGTGKGAMSGKYYKILGLNVSYKQRMGLLVADIKRDPIFPHELTSSLYY